MPGESNGGEAGIRTLGTGFSPYNGLANRTGASEPHDSGLNHEISWGLRDLTLGGVGLRWVAIDPRGHRHGHSFPERSPQEEQIKIRTKKGLSGRSLTIGT